MRFSVKDTADVMITARRTGELTMKKYWNSLLLKDIEKVGGVGGRFGTENMNIYFTVLMKDGQKHHFHYDSRRAYDERRELKKLFNEVNNVPEYYLLENEMFLEVGSSRFSFGCRVNNNLDESEYLTNTQIERLKRQGKIRDEGWRHLAYICPLRIENKKVVHGELTEAFKEELDALGVEYEDPASTSEDDKYEVIECSECDEEKPVEKGTWALSNGMCEQCYCAYQGS
ncbi:hypothetical protein [Peribacillus asahii]|uniref:hypothetical protein n=1 Tax=Peribacillus asahii TaxID=228899 RepID=UPI00380AB504